MRVIHTPGRRGPHRSLTGRDMVYLVEGVTRVCDLEAAVELMIDAFCDQLRQVPQAQTLWSVYRRAA